MPIHGPGFSIDVGRPFSRVLIDVFGYTNGHVVSGFYDGSEEFERILSVMQVKLREIILRLEDDNVYEFPCPSFATQYIRPGLGAIQTSIDVDIGRHVQAGFLIDMMEDLLDAHPVLRSRAIVKNDMVMLRTDRTVMDMIVDNEASLEIVDPSQRPVLLLVPDEGSSRFLIRISHLLYDAVSIGILKEDIRSMVRDKPLRREIGILDWTSEMCRRRSFDNRERLVRRLGGMIHHNGGNVTYHRDTRATIKNMIIEADIPFLRAVLERHGIKLSTFIIATATRAYSQLTGENLVPLSILFNGRVLPETQNAIGCLVDLTFLEVDTRHDNVIEHLSNLSLDIMGSTELFGALTITDFLRMYPDAPLLSINYVVSGAEAMEPEEVKELTYAASGTRNLREIRMEMTEYEGQLSLYLTSHLDLEDMHRLIGMMERSIDEMSGQL